MGKSTATAAAILKPEKATFDAACKCPLTRILSHPSGTKWDKLVKENFNLALECSVTYNWTGDYGLLAEIMGNGPYLLLKGQEYMEPMEPPKYPEELNKDSIKDERDRAITELDEET